MFPSLNEYTKGLLSCFVPFKSLSRDKKGFINRLPDELLNKIFSYLQAKELSHCLSVTIKWKTLASDNNLWKALYPTLIFGKEQWVEYFGDPGQERPLPKNIYEIIESPCPFFPQAKIKHTHILVLIPEKINNEPLNLDTLGKLIKVPKKNFFTRFGYGCTSDLSELEWKACTTYPYWALMTKDIIPGSSNQTYQEQLTYIAKQTKPTKHIQFNYTAPNILETCICIFSRFIQCRETLFPSSRTRCQEGINGSQIIIGGFFNAKLQISHRSKDERNFYIGIGAIQKFF